MKRRRREIRRGVRLGAAALGLLVLSGTGALRGAQEPLECRIVFQAADQFYLDAGTDDGLSLGSSGIVYHDGAEVARVEVLQANRKSAVVKEIHRRGIEGPRPQDRAVFMVDRASPPAPESGRSLLQEPGSEPFVPLLTPPRQALGYTDPRNIFHGRLRAQELFQLDGERDQDYSISRLGSDGTLERIGGKPWSLEWSGDLFYRDGAGLEGSSDFQDLRLDVYRLSLSRRFDDRSTARIGRFIPFELPGVGYMDGAQGEKALSGSLRVGAIAGLKPDRADLESSIQEPTAVLYATTELGERRKVYYSGTLGVLGSLFDGHADRLAVLLDQRADFGPKLSLFSTTEVDFDVGGAEVSTGPRLTRLDLYAVSALTSFLTVRGGLDHYQRPDTQAERDTIRGLSDPLVDELFDRGYWRYWIGSTQRLPWRFSLDEEIAFIEAPEEDFTPRWRVSLSRYGTILANDTITLSLYNLDGSDAEGYGGLLWGAFPMLDGALILRPGAGFRFLETGATDVSFQISNVSIYADWTISRAWSAFGGVNQYFGDETQFTLIEVGVEFRW